MRSSSKRAFSRVTALAVGAGVLGSLALAGPTFATAPTAGVACQPDGKINGRGATFQKNAQNLAFAVGYRDDVCGAVAGGPAEVGNLMVIYNYANAEIARPAPQNGPYTGSGQGITGAQCRTDGFNGTDVPYTKAQLTTLRAAPPAPAAAPCDRYSTLAPFLTPVFEPTNLTGVFPDGTAGGAPDQQAPIMSFPVAGGAVSIGINLPDASCGGTAPTSIRLNELQASRLFGGQIANWTDAALVAIQEPGSTLGACNQAVTRVVRLDNSGTTTIFKNYLANADGARLLCDGSTWSARRGQVGGFVATGFPAPGGACSAAQAVGGNPAVVTTTATTAGAVGYGDLSDWQSLAPAAVLASVQSADDSAFPDPNSGNASNCSFGGAALPAGGNPGAVGLNTTPAGDPATNTWASDGSPNRADQTFRPGTASYPICGFTWDFVYTGLNRNGGANTAISQLNANQRRTLYSYMIYALSPAAQDRLGAQGYAPVPSGLLGPIRRGFQAGF